MFKNYCGHGRPSQLLLSSGILFTCTTTLKSKLIVLEGNVSCRPEAETVARHSCRDVSEVVVTNGSPDTVVVDFQTSFMVTRAANQPHCP